MSETPKRIQLKRTKGWRMPSNAVKVDRSTRWGNPFRVEQCREAGYLGTDAEIAGRCVEAFKVWLGPMWRNYWDSPESECARERLIDSLDLLRGRDLACWCPLDQPCHADVLLKLANEPRP